MLPLHVTDAGTTGTPSRPAAPAAAPAPSSSSSRGPAAFNDSIPEQLFYEGSASNAELLINLLLAFTLVYIPITIAVVGKRLWIKYRFTNKRVQVINTSPLFAKEVRRKGGGTEGAGVPGVLWSKGQPGRAGPLRQAVVLSHLFAR